MKRSCLPVAIAFASIFASPGFCKSEPSVSKSPLAEDQVQVYRAFLNSYLKEDSSHVNLATRTNPLILSAFMTNCLKELPLENIAETKRTVHVIGTEITAHFNINLVDPKNFRLSDPENAIRRGKSVEQAVQEGFAGGILSMSEVAFDANHQHAVMSYSFNCGSLCGHGATFIYEKTDHGWVAWKGTKCMEQWVS